MEERYFADEIADGVIKLRPCTKCLVPKPLSEFYKNPTGRGGLQGWCKECAAKHNAVRNFKDAMKEDGPHWKRTENKMFMRDASIEIQMLIADKDFKSAGVLLELWLDAIGQDGMISTDHTIAMIQNRK
jgi:hypothetical protein